MHYSSLARFGAMCSETSNPIGLHNRSTAYKENRSTLRKGNDVFIFIFWDAIMIGMLCGIWDDAIEFSGKKW